MHILCKCVCRLIKSRSFPMVIRPKITGSFLRPVTCDNLNGVQSNEHIDWDIKHILGHWNEKIPLDLWYPRGHGIHELPKFAHKSENGMLLKTKLVLLERGMFLQITWLLGDLKFYHWNFMVMICQCSFSSWLWMIPKIVLILGELGRTLLPKK